MVYKESEVNMKKAIYNIMLITIIAKLFGFGREILLSYFFGAGGISDAYLTAQTIPGTIFQFVGTGLATSFIPVYMKAKLQENSKTADQFTNRVLTAVLVFSTVIIILVWQFAEPLIKVFASGFTGETLRQAALFLRIGIISLYFSSFIYVYNSYLQANNIFTIVAFGAIPNSIMIMLAIVLGARLHILALPIGSLAAVFIQMLILFPSMRKAGYRWKLDFKFKDPYVKEIIRLMLPVTIGVSVNQINVLIDRTMASQIAIGGISALLYADSLMMFVQGIFSQSIATVYYPALTEYAEKKQTTELKKLLNEALESIVFMLAPIMMGCIILGKGIVEVLYGRGAFDATAVTLTGTALSFYGIGILAYGIREILSRLFYAQHDTKTPMINSMIGMILNIAMNLTFSRMLGIGGLALATSASCILTAVLLYIYSRKRMGVIVDREAKTEYKKIFLATGLMAMIVWGIYKFLNGISGVIISVLAGVLVYAILSIILKIEVFKKLKGMLIRKSKG